MTLGYRLNMEQEQGKAEQEKNLCMMWMSCLLLFPEQWSLPLTSMYMKKQKAFGCVQGAAGPGFAWRVYVCVCVS